MKGISYTNKVSIALSSAMRALSAIQTEQEKNIYCCKNVVIEANSANFVEGRTQSSVVAEGILVPSEQLAGGLVIPSSVVCVNNKFVNVYIRNMTNTVKRIPKHQNIACILNDKIIDPTDLDMNDTTERTNVTDSNAKRTNTNIDMTDTDLDENQQHEVNMLCKEYADIFAVNSRFRYGERCETAHKINK